MIQVVNFKEWNERMAVKYNPDHYHNSHNIFIRILTRLRTHLIIKLLAVKKDDAVLDLGCGAGNMLAAVETGHLTGVDLSSSLIDLAKEKLAGRDAQLFIGSVEDLPSEISTQKYDKIFSSEVIEHIEHPEKMIDQLLSVAKPESLVVVSFPNESLVRQIKTWLLKLKLFKIFFKNLSPEMADEWHLHEIKKDYFAKLIAGKLRVIAVKKIPFPFLPLHYIYLCKKI